MEKRRPVFFNLLQIQLPVGALSPIAHRITGVILAVGIPFGVYVLDLSLRGPQTYARVTGMLDNWALRGAAIVFVWTLAHHLLAGVRHLLSDIDIGTQLPAARRSAWIVNLGGAALALAAAGAWL